MRTPTVSCSVVRGALLAAALAAGCAAPAANEEAPNEEPAGTATSAITGGGSSATEFMKKRSVSVDGSGDISGNCTGVILDRRHVLTASHCRPIAGVTKIRFYGSTDGLPLATGGRGITSVAFPPGVHPETGDRDDTNGNFADIAVLTLDEFIPAWSVPAEIDLGYPGADAAVMQVGRGQWATTTTTTRTASSAMR